jgi:hypothetical protein
MAAAKRLHAAKNIPQVAGDNLHTAKSVSQVAGDNLHIAKSVRQITGDNLHAVKTCCRIATGELHATEDAPSPVSAGLRNGKRRPAIGGAINKCRCLLTSINGGGVKSNCAVIHPEGEIPRQVSELFNMRKVFRHIILFAANIEIIFMTTHVSHLF